MEQVHLHELKLGSREEALRFLKLLWNETPAACPLCGQALELLHKGAKKSNCDWQCRHCGKTFKTLHLLDELNALL